MHNQFSWWFQGSKWSKLHIFPWSTIRGGSRAAATSKMERFVKPLTIITKHSILDVAAALDPLLTISQKTNCCPWIYLFHDGGHYHIQTTHWNGFCMIRTSVMKEVIKPEGSGHVVQQTAKAYSEPSQTLKIKSLQIS